MNETPWARANAVLERTARNEECQKHMAALRALNDLRAELSELCEIATPPDDLLRRAKELGAKAAMLRELRDYMKNVAGGSTVMLCGVQQEYTGSGKFLVSEAASEDGWSWPVQVMRSGWAHGSVTEASGKVTKPHYFSEDAVAQVAKAVNGARFRRRHPTEAEGDGSGSPELTAGWMSNGLFSGSAAVATVNLLKSATDIRSMLMAAREAAKLDLFGVSIFGYFVFQESRIEGKPALVATRLQRFVGLDFCAEPGAGGRFMPTASQN